jgi:hypothetical protein
VKPYDSRHPYCRFCKESWHHYSGRYSRLLRCLLDFEFGLVDRDPQALLIAMVGKIRRHKELDFGMWDGFNERMLSL